MNRKNYHKEIDLKTNKPMNISKNDPKNYKFPWYKNELLYLILFVGLLITKAGMDFIIMNINLANENRIDGLSEGYFGFKRDTNDKQWRAWRENLPLMACGALLFLGIVYVNISCLLCPFLLAKVLSFLIKRTHFNHTHNKKPQLIYYICFGALYLTYIFRSGMIYWVSLTMLNFILIHYLARNRLFPAAIWALNLMILYCNETYHGYGFDWLPFNTTLLQEEFNEAPVRWNIIFNMTILRMISFGMDKYWAYKTFSNIPKQEIAAQPLNQQDTNSLTLKARQETPQPLENYILLNYYAYLLYPPLYISGPIVAFNAWISQVFIPQTTYSPTQVIIYGLRWLMNFILFEIWVHTLYVNTLATNVYNENIWKSFNISQLLLLSLLALIFIWFKFLIIWRFARLWGLLDGFESPENMNRCMCNNYTFEGFWRSWHRAFNQWLIRYIFIPLGGSKFKLYNIWVVFGFVAIWHDMNINLVMWAWVICLCLMPEMLIKNYFKKPKFIGLWKTYWFKYLASFGGAVIVVLMIIANLIGFGTGVQGIYLLLELSLQPSGIFSIIISMTILWAAVTMMFYVREKEEEKGAVKGF